VDDGDGPALDGTTGEGGEDEQSEKRRAHSAWREA